VELVGWFAANSLARYRADQVLRWVYRHNVSQWSGMGNISGELRGRLAERFCLRGGEIKDTFRCADGTVKLLTQWSDNAATETVLMCDGKRRTVCVSSQIGCAVSCAFCASGLGGLERSLEAGEIVEQVVRAKEQLTDGERISNVVVMGMGEPFANYDNTLKAVRIINADWGLNIGARHITISTIGLPEAIVKLADEPIQVTLAVSLHAGDDELRGQLIPWAKKYKLKELFEAIDYYYRQTHREVTLEYVLLDGVNCLPGDADKVAQLVRQTRCNVNLINYNRVEETGYRPTDMETANAFMQRLGNKGINVHLRKSYGQEITAACGQLRRKTIDSR